MPQKQHFSIQYAPKDSNNGNGVGNQAGKKWTGTFDHDVKKNQANCGAYHAQDGDVAKGLPGLRVGGQLVRKISPCKQIQEGHGQDHEQGNRGNFD